MRRNSLEIFRFGARCAATAILVVGCGETTHMPCDDAVGCAKDAGREAAAITDAPSRLDAPNTSPTAPDASPDLAREPMTLPVVDAAVDVGADATDASSPVTRVDASVDAGETASLDAAGDVAPDESAAPPPPPPCTAPMTGDFHASFCLEGTRWPDWAVPACWAPTSVARSDFSTWAPRVRSVVTEQFVRVARIDVTGWGVCTAADLQRAVLDPSLLVLSLADAGSTTADLGAGDGGVRKLAVGVASSAWESDVIAPFFRVLGFRPVDAPRASLPRLTFEEAATLIGFAGNRPGGAIVGAGGVCLQAANPGGGSVRPLTIDDCLWGDDQRFQFTTRGAIVQPAADPKPRLVGVASESRVDVATVADAPDARFTLSDGALVVMGGLCLAVPGDFVFSGQSILTAACDGSAGQRWTITPEGNIRHGSACLTVPGGRADPVTALTLQTCASDVTQRFFFRADGTIRYEDQCLDINGGAPVTDTNLILWPCKPSDIDTRSNQVFFYRGPIRSGDRCLNVPASTGTDRVRFDACDGSAAQSWDVHLDRIVLE
jgi:hypothetical protein